MRSPADPADVEEQPSDGGLDAEDIKFLRSLRTSATPGPSSDGEAGERSIARRLSSRTVKKLEVASDEIELQPSVWDSALFQFASVSGRGASVFTLVLLVVNCVEINQCVGVAMIQHERAVNCDFHTGREYTHAGVIRLLPHGRAHREAHYA